MAEYGFTVDDVLNLSIKRFWFISNMIDRLRAEKDLRQIQLLGSVGSPEAYKAAHDYLKDQVGQVWVLEVEAPTEFKIDPDTGLDPDFDRAGLRAMKMKIAAAR
jgi:hypothetical protein